MGFAQDRSRQGAEADVITGPWAAAPSSFTLLARAIARLDLPLNSSTAPLGFIEANYCIWSGLAMRPAVQHRELCLITYDGR